MAPFWSPPRGPCVQRRLDLCLTCHVDWSEDVDTLGIDLPAWLWYPIETVFAKAALTLQDRGMEAGISYACFLFM